MGYAEAGGKTRPRDGPLSQSRYQAGQLKLPGLLAAQRRHQGTAS
jgi:hypothetical protein